jgi:hypothetical protein
MAYTEPPAWGVGHLFTANEWTTYIRNNFRYLKGTDGVITLDSGILLPASAGTPAQHVLPREMPAKGLCSIAAGAASGVVVASFNVSGTTRHGTGDYTITWDRDFASAAYQVCISMSTGGVVQTTAQWLSKAAGSIRIQTINSSSGASVDTDVDVVAFGAQ